MQAAERRDLGQTGLQRQAQAERDEQRQRPRPRAHDRDVGVDPPAAREGAHAVALRRERDALLALVDDGSRRACEPHLQLDRALREDHRAVALEDRRRVRLRAHLGKDPRDVAVVELVVGDPGLAQRRGHGRHDGAALEQAVAAEQRLSPTPLEVVPELERPHREPHVGGVRVREAERARVVPRATEVVPDRMLLEQRDGPSALGEHPRGRGAHRAGPDDDRGATFRPHAAPGRTSAATACSRSACTASAT